MIQLIKQYSLALFIGRFQPFHKGHLYSLRKAMKMGERVMIGIGSSQEKRTDSNPWSYEERKNMVEAMIAREPILRGWSSQVKIVGISDYELDSEWADEVVRVVRKVGYESDEVVAVGNNDWTNDVLAEVGMDVLESGLHQRDELEGVKIRQMMRKGDENWRERVPECVSKNLDLRVFSW